MKTGLYSYKLHLQCAEIRKINGKLYCQYLCSVSGAFCSYEVIKGHNYWYLTYIGEV